MPKNREHLNGANAGILPYIGGQSRQQSGTRANDEAKELTMIKRLLKFLLFLIVLAMVALIIYAYLGDLSPSQTEIQEPLTIEIR